MPSTFSTLDTGFPTFTGGESTEQKVSALYDYTFLLLENLRYILRNLSPENFNEKETLDWLKDKVVANTVISNTVVTNELYANYGEIADLVVDELRTDYQKAWFYLAGNTDNIDYLHIYDENIEFITGSVKMENNVPLTEHLHRTFRIPGSWDNVRKEWQYESRYFWWKTDEDTGTRYMTYLEDTGVPVIVYQYRELVKGSYRFDDVPEGGVTNKIPALTFGAGYGQTDPDRGKGFIRKNTDSFDLWLVSGSGVRRGVFIGDKYNDNTESFVGYTDIWGMRKPTTLDFASWDSGYFSEVLDGGARNDFSITFDGEGKPTRFVDLTGHETAVVWS